MVDFKKSVKGTILARVLDVMESGQFIACDEPVAEGEVPIFDLGEFELEKSIFTVNQQIFNKLNALVESGQRIDPKVGSLLKKDYDLTSDLFWNCVKHRLVESGKKVDFQLGVREGYKIVSVPNKARDPLETLLMLLGGGLPEQEGGHQHNCETCPIYNGCELPIKKKIKG